MTTDLQASADAEGLIKRLREQAAIVSEATAPRMSVIPGLLTDLADALAAYHAALPNPIPPNSSA